jgi:hypothetical protein
MGAVRQLDPEYELVRANRVRLQVECEIHTGQPDINLPVSVDHPFDIDRDNLSSIDPKSVSHFNWKFRLSTCGNASAQEHCKYGQHPLQILQ